MSRRMEQGIFLAVCVLCAASIAVLSVGLSRQGDKNARFAAQGQEAHDALCVLKADLTNRVKSSEEFLADHPDGIPGIPAATIRTSLDGQRRTVAALSNLECVT